MIPLSKENVIAHKLEFEKLIPQEDIMEKIDRTGALLNDEFHDKKPIFIGVLNGAFMFMADLVRTFQFDCEISFIKLSSYNGLNSTGKVNTILGLEHDLKDRHVIIVEDIIDSGETLHQFIPQIKSLQPASVTLVAFLVKRECMKYDIPIDHLCFEIPGKFVIGYGLDYDGLGRNLKHIYQLAE